MWKLLIAVMLLVTNCGYVQEMGWDKTKVYVI
jgi:hypothetical protein